MVDTFYMHKNPGNKGVRSPPHHPRGVTLVQSSHGEGVNVFKGLVATTCFLQAV